MLKDRIAFLDFDGTLYKGFSVNDFIVFLANRFNDDEARACEDETIDLYKSGKISYEEGTERVNKLLASLLKGLNISSVDGLASEFWIIKKRNIYPWARRLIRFLKDEGFHVNIISGTPNVLIEQVAGILGAEGFLTSKLTVFEGKYTGDVEIILHSEVKKNIIKRIIEKSSKSFTIAIGDSTGDVGMFKLVDKAFIVNAHQENLAKTAQKLGWYTAKDGDEIIDSLRKVI